MRIRVEESPSSGVGFFPMPGPEANAVYRKIRHSAVIDLKGSLAEKGAVHGLHCKIRDLLDEGIMNFAINLADVPSADGYTLGGLAGAYNLIREAGGRVKFFAASERLLRAFRKFHLDTVLELVEDERSALSSLQ
jgi:anti-anti-sigma factor